MNERMKNAPVTSRTRADADLDSSTSEHDAVACLECEDDLDWTSVETSNTRTETVKLQQRCHPLCSRYTYTRQQN